MNALPQIKEKTCNVCDYVGMTAEDFCPKCRHKLNIKGNIKALGAIMICLGLFLVGVMGAIILLIGVTIASAGDPSATSRWNGTPLQTTITFTILGLVMIFGFTSIFNGIYQIVTGRLNQKSVGAIFILGGILFAGAKIIVLFFGD